MGALSVGGRDDLEAGLDVFSLMFGAAERALNALIYADDNAEDCLFRFLGHAFFIKRQADTDPGGFAAFVKSRGASIGAGETVPKGPEVFALVLRMLFGGAESEEAIGLYAGALDELEREGGQLGLIDDVVRALNTTGIGQRLMAARGAPSKSQLHQTPGKPPPSIGELANEADTGMDVRAFLELIARHNEAVDNPPAGQKLERPDIKKIYRFGKSKRKTVISPLCYPGSKRGFIDLLAEWMPRGMLEYREPFFGGGNIYFNFAQELKDAGAKVLVNEKSRGLYSYWLMVRDDPEALIRGYDDRFATIKGDFEFSKRLLNELIDEINNGNELEAAIAYATANSISFGGIVNTVWKREIDKPKHSRAKNIRLCHQLLQGVEITNLDFHDIFKRPGDGVLLMVDPPYDDSASVYPDTMSYEQFFVDLIESQHAWLVTHSDTFRHRGRRLWSRMMGNSPVLYTQPYEMGRGVVRRQKGSALGKNRKADGKPITADDLRLEVLITNYDPKSPVWDFWGKVAKFDRNGSKSPPIDPAAVAHWIREQADGADG